MNGNLILNDRPLIIIPTLAMAIGKNESVILQQLHYWMKRSKNIREDRKWVYFTYDQLREQIPYISKSTIRRAVLKLEKNNLITSDNFNKMKMDHTKWYTINYEKLSELECFENNNLNNDDVLSETEMSPSATVDKSICPERADDVLNMDNPSVQNEQTMCSNWTEDVPTMNTAIPESTTEITSENISETSSSNHANDKEYEPFQFFEQNGFGKIGNYYAKKIKSWCTEFSCEIVIKAMKLALENGSNRWNYVEAILKDWISKGYRTVKEILDAKLVFKVQKQKKTIAKPVRREFIPEWLDKDTQPETPVFDLDFAAKKRLFEDRLKVHG